MFSKRSIVLYVVAVLLTLGAIRLDAPVTDLCPTQDDDTDSMVVDQPHLVRVAQEPPKTIDCSDDSQLVSLALRYGAILIWGCALASTVADVQKYRKRKKARRRRSRRTDESTARAVEVADAPESTAPDE